MVGTDIWPGILGSGCAICLAPIILLFIGLRLAIWLERFLFRHSLLLFLIPVTMWLHAGRREQRRQKEWEQYQRNKLSQHHQGAGCYKMSALPPTPTPVQARVSTGGKSRPLHG